MITRTWAYHLRVGATSIVYYMLGNKVRASYVEEDSTDLDIKVKPVKDKATLRAVREIFEFHIDETEQKKNKNKGKARR